MFKALGGDQSGKLALRQVICRVLSPATRLSSPKTRPAFTPSSPRPKRAELEAEL